jgi:hypothetical protein
MSLSSLLLLVAFLLLTLAFCFFENSRSGKGNPDAFQILVTDFQPDAVIKVATLPEPLPEGNGQYLYRASCKDAMLQVITARPQDIKVGNEVKLVLIRYVQSSRGGTSALFLTEKSE